MWDGSDVDLAALLRRCRETALASTEFASRLRAILPEVPIAAPRHAYQSGVFRVLETQYVDSVDIAVAPSVDPTADGVVRLVLPAGVSIDKALIKTARVNSVSLQDGRPVLVVLPSEPDELRDRLLDVFAIADAQDSVEVAHDAVVRRELEERRIQAGDLLSEQLARSFGTRARCFTSGKEINGSVRLSAIGSTALDAAYHQAPRILNELVNRREVSSAAAAARRILMERRLTAAQDPTLRIEGHPPELSMYLSVLRETGLHVQAAYGTWQFIDPTADHQLAPVWTRIAAAIDANGAGRCQLSDVIDALALPPIGVREGISPHFCVGLLPCRRTARVRLRRRCVHPSAERRRHLSHAPQATEHRASASW